MCLTFALRTMSPLTLFLAGRKSSIRARMRRLDSMLPTPGLIDQHVHVFSGLGNFCLEQDQVGVGMGVPILVDAGTSGVATFALARRAIIEHGDTKTRVMALIDPCQLYLATTMSKIWALGVPLLDVAAMVTTNPAETMKYSDTIGRIAVGREAHLSVLQVTEAPVTLSDGFRSIKADRVLEPVGCTVRGIWFDADSYASHEVLAA